MDRTTDDGAPVLAAGVITIHIPDFMKQLTTFRTWGESRVGAMEGFGRLFLGQLWDVYGRFFRDRRRATRGGPSEARRAGRALRRAELHAAGRLPLAVAERAAHVRGRRPCRMIFGNYADKRELQKVFDSNLIVMPPADQPLPEGGDFWFDYTADVGDGFEATYTVAALLGQDSLQRRGPRRRAAARADAGARRRPGLPAGLVEGLRGPHRRPLPLGHAAGHAAAADAGAARQPRLVRRPHGVPAPVHPGPDDRRLAHRAEAQLLHRPAAAPLVAGRPRQPARHLLRRPAAEVLRGDPDRQPPARRQRDRLLRDAGLGQGVVGTPGRLQRAGVVRAQLRQPPRGSRAPTSSSRPAPRPGCGSAATSTTTSATRSGSPTPTHPRARRGRW